MNHHAGGHERGPEFPLIKQKRTLDIKETTDHFRVKSENLEVQIKKSLLEPHFFCEMEKSLQKVKRMHQRTLKQIVSRRI